jgi:flagellar protein FlaI
MKGLGKTKKLRYPKITLRRPRHLIVIPTPKDVTETSVKYPLIDPFASAEITWIPEKKGLVYTLVEPAMSDREKRLLKKLEESLTEVIDVKLSKIKTREKIIDYLQERVQSVLEDLGITVRKEVYEKVMYYIIRDFFGLNEIEPLMYDPYIEDIGCNGLKTPVFIIHKKFGSLRTNLVYNDPDRLTDFVVKLSERCGRYISYAVPLLDGSLPDGSRIQASLAKDVTTRGPTFSIRKFRSNPYSPIDLIELGTASSKMMAYLWLLVHYSASVMICGGVSTGKTTFLNVLSMFIPPEDKVISIEDTREINIPHENWIPAVSRTGFGIPGSSGKRYGEISMFDLLKESFRQNPDYVVVGEVRGKEAYVMFQGMASGHPSMGTIHAGSVDDVMKRLETPPIELSPSLIESLDLLIVLTNAKEKGKSSRRVKEVVEIQSVDSRTGIAHTKESFSWIPSDDLFRETLAESDLLRKISFQEGIPYQDLMDELKEREKILEWMRKHKVFQFDEACRLINLYYKDRDTLMEWVDKDISPGEPNKKLVAKKVWESGSKERIKKSVHPPIIHKPDISYKQTKPKIELKEILSKVKTKPFKIPSHDRFLKKTTTSTTKKPITSKSRSPMKRLSKSSIIKKPIPIKSAPTKKPRKPIPEDRLPVASWISKMKKKPAKAVSPSKSNVVSSVGKPTKPRKKAISMDGLDPSVQKQLRKINKLRKKIKEDYE